MLVHPSTMQAVTHIAMHPAQLYAVAIQLARAVHVLVYRSPELVRDDDEIYKPVRDVIGDAKPLVRTIEEDPNMWFGEAEMSAYMIGVP